MKRKILLSSVTALLALVFAAQANASIGDRFEHAGGQRQQWYGRDESRDELVYPRREQSHCCAVQPDERRRLEFHDHRQSRDASHVHTDRI